MPPLRTAGRGRATRPRGPQDHWQRLDVETPEHVILSYELAGFGSRLLAALADFAILTAVGIAIIFVLGAIGGNTSWGATVLTLVTFGLTWGYFVCFEGFYRGQTPGKRWVGLRVVRDSGQPIGFGEAAIRNLLRIADFLPPPFLTGLALIIFHPRAKRLGDLVAGTVVVRDRPAEAGGAPMVPQEEPAHPQLAADEAPLLSNDEFRMLEELIARSATLDPAARSRFAGRLVDRFSAAIPAGTSGIEALEALLVSETRRRQGRFGVQSGTGGAGDRFVRQKRSRWVEFEALAGRAATEGLDSFQPAELLDFTARYREIAADYARARTYRVHSRDLLPLERAASAGHNAIYREGTIGWRQAWSFLAVDCPAAVIASRRAVLLAFLCFVAPALLGFGLLRERPAIAAEVIPDVMLARAEAGAERMRQGKGYFDADPGDRPLIAASIIANNVRVSFFCFAGGIFLGVGSLVLLAFNGLSIGASSGHFANAGLLGYLWTFVAGHGLLELFAIWVAGAAGFQLGLAIISPGRMARRDALVLGGRRAIRMVGFAVVLLLVAGLVEGLVSASDLDPGIKLAVSGGSAVLLVVYLAAGLRGAASDGG